MTTFLASFLLPIALIAVTVVLLLGPGTPAQWLVGAGSIVRMGPAIGRKRGG